MLLSADCRNTCRLQAATRPGNLLGCWFGLLPVLISSVLIKFGVDKFGVNKCFITRFATVLVWCLVGFWSLGRCIRAVCGIGTMVLGLCVQRQVEMILG